jgi:hypothetical protein
VSVAGTPWASNQWASYVVKRTTNIGNLGGNTFSEIVGNTANTLSYTTAIQGGNLQFTPGDTFQIWKVSQAMDQVGRSGGPNLNGVTTPTPTVGWNTQTTSPWYEWNNTRDGGININFESDALVIRPNEHFFNNVVRPGYTPYTYPHPLTQGAAPPPPPPSQPAAPTNVRIVTNQ